MSFWVKISFWLKMRFRVKMSFSLKMSFYDLVKMSFSGEIQFNILIIFLFKNRSESSRSPGKTRVVPMLPEKDGDVVIHRFGRD